MGTDRDLGEADLFIPLSQDENTLFFTTLRRRRAQGDDGPER